MCSTQLIFYSSLDHYICICCSLDADKTGQHLHANYAIKLPNYFYQMAETASKPIKVVYFAFIMYF